MTEVRDPSLSVIVPVFNDPTGLARCLDALADQSISQDRFEVIVVDNGSDPQVTIASYNSLCVRILNEPTPGSYAARNAGAGQARGSLIAFTDADCLPRSDWLERGMEALSGLRGNVVVGGAIRMCLPNEVDRNAAALYDLCLGLRQEDYWKNDGFLMTANLFVPASIFRSVGAFRTDIFSGGDREWCMRASSCGVDLRFCPDAVVDHPVRQGWKELHRKVLRIAGGGMARGRERGARVDGNQRLGLERKLGVAAGILREPRLRNWRERAKVFLVATVVLVWKLEARIRRALGLPDYR